MSAQEIIEQIKSLPAKDRAEVTKFVVETDDSWIPEEFKEGMADIAAGRVVDLDTAMNTNGTVPFTDLAFPSFSQRYYRVMVAP
jgi:hypothetical protein